ncbi:MAG TPA: VOC family protein [Caulobacter sp.]|nr:VOC family protein [Caulobacter sp.]
MKVTQHLWYEKDMEAAIRFYTSLIPNSRIEDVSAVMGESPAGPAGSVTIISFVLGGQNYMAIEAGPLDPFNHSFSIMVEPETQEDLDRLWDALSEGGSIEQCGWLKDRWGLCWQIAPKRLRELMDSPDKAVVKRVTEQMLKMVKLDIAPLEAAAAG